MTTCPVFYFSSKKENPKTHIQVNLKNNQQNDPSVEFKSNININLKIEGVEYLLNLDYLVNCEISKEPVTNINYSITKLEDIKKEIFNESVNNLISFMDSFKVQIVEEVKNKSKELLELEQKKKEDEQRIREEDEQRIREEEEQKKKEDEEEQKKKEEEQKRKYNELLKLDEETKINNFENTVNDLNSKEDLNVIEDIKIYNNKIIEQNRKLEDEEKMHLDVKSVIENLKEELEKLKVDEAIIENSDNNAKDEKLKYFKEKYNISSEFDPIKLLKQEKDVNSSNVDLIKSELQIEDELFEQLKLLVTDDKNIIITNLIYIITQLMKFVENFNMEGIDKKTLIIETIKKFLKYENMNSEEIDIILDKVCPELIDILLLVDKRKIIIRKKINCFIPWCI